MSILFDRDKLVISRHINKILEEKVRVEVVVAKFATTAKHCTVERKILTFDKVLFKNCTLLIYYKKNKKVK